MQTSILSRSTVPGQRIEFTRYPRIGARPPDRHSRLPRLDHRQPGAHRTFGIVLMRLRVAEIDQHAITHVFSDKAFKATNRLANRAVVIPDQLAQILRVMTGRQRGRAD